MSKEALTLKKILLGIGVLLVIGYAVFNSRFLIQGPEITIDNIDSATGGIISEQKTLFLEGNAKHSSFISILIKEECLAFPSKKSVFCSLIMPPVALSILSIVISGP